MRLHQNVALSSATSSDLNKAHKRYYAEMKVWLEKLMKDRVTSDGSMIKRLEDAKILSVGPDGDFHIESRYVWFSPFAIDKTSTRKPDSVVELDDLLDFNVEPGFTAITTDRFEKIKRVVLEFMDGGLVPKNVKILLASCSVGEARVLAGWLAKYQYGLIVPNEVDFNKRPNILVDERMFDGEVKRPGRQTVSLEELREHVKMYNQWADAIEKVRVVTDVTEALRIGRPTVKVPTEMVGESFLKEVTEQAASVVHDLTSVADAEAVSAGQDVKPSMITLLGSIDLVRLVAEEMDIAWQELLRQMIIREVSRTVDLSDSMRTAVLHEVTNTGDLGALEALEIHKILAPRCVTGLIGVTGAALVRRLVSGSFALRIALGERHSRVATLRKLYVAMVCVAQVFTYERKFVAVSAQNWDDRTAQIKLTERSKHINEISKRYKLNIDCYKFPLHISNPLNLGRNDKSLCWEHRKFHLKLGQSKARSLKRALAE